MANFYYFSSNKEELREFDNIPNPFLDEFWSGPYRVDNDNNSVVNNIVTRSG